MYFQKHHWIQMVNNGTGQPKIVTGCIFHISSEEEKEKKKKKPQKPKGVGEPLGRQVGQNKFFLIPVKFLLCGLAMT